MPDKRNWTDHVQQKDHHHNRNKQARKSYDQAHPFRPKDIFDTYTTGQKQHEKKHQQSGNTSSTKPVSQVPVLDRVALFTQLCYELEHDPAFIAEFTNLAGDQTATKAFELAKQVNSEKTLLSGIASQRPHIPYDAVKMQGGPTLETWFDQYPDHLPALPPILDPDLETQVFTASGFSSQPGKSSTSYERLEWLGDAYLEVITRRIVYHIYKDSTEGLMAQITSDFVRNEHLARLSLAYGFDDRLQLGIKHMASYKDSARKSMTKVYGDVFEAYVAAVIESDPVNGYQTAYHWLMALIKPTLLKYKQAVPVNQMAKEDLAKKVLGKGIRLEWEEYKKSMEVKGGRMYYYNVYMCGWGYSRQFLGSGEGPSKQQAQILAAMEALSNPTTAVICAIKKEYDALVKIEREKEGGPDPEVIAALDQKYKAIPVV